MRTKTGFGSFRSPETEPARVLKKRKREEKHKRRRTRPWVHSPRDFSSFKERFVVVSYNILGAENASRHQDLYEEVDPEYLRWDHRKMLIYKELIRYNPSVICLQEVDRYNDVANLLHKEGYIGSFKGRTGGSRDGCAMFWKEDRFTLLHEENIEFRRLSLKENVAQLCLLKVCTDCSSTSISDDDDPELASVYGRTLLVGNIHVLFNPNRGDIKLGQARVLLERAHAISQKWGNSPVVICGDWNSIPQSAVYQYLSSPELEILKYERKKISGQIEFSSKDMPCFGGINTMGSGACMRRCTTYRWSEEEIRLASGSRGGTQLLNPLRLSSAYQGVPGDDQTRGSNGEPLVTSYHSKFMGTVDYIWHSAALAPVAVVETLPVDALKKLGGLPSKNWGSDHLALACEFAFVTDVENCKTKS